MKPDAYLYPDPAAFDTEARPNSIAGLMPPVPEVTAKPQRQQTPDFSPSLLSARLHHPEILLTFEGRNRTYMLHDTTGRAARLAAGALVMVRICSANPRHAEVFEPGISLHRFLGHALSEA